MNTNSDNPKTPKSNSNVKDNLKSLPMPELQKKLGSSPDGLIGEEAKKRLTQYGPNEIEEKKNRPFLKYLNYFWGPRPWMIEGMLIISGIFRLWKYFFILLFMLLANALITLWLAFRKERR